MHYKAKYALFSGAFALIGMTALGYVACAAGALSSAQAPLIVDRNSKVIVMEYEAWFTPKHPMGAVPHHYEPALTTADMIAKGQPGYDSQDPLIIKQHIAWLSALGVNAIIAEQTNGGPCDLNYSSVSNCVAFLQRKKSPLSVQPSYSETITSINQSTFNLYPEFARNGSGIKIIPLLDGQDLEMYAGNGSDDRTPFDTQVEAYLQRMGQYSGLNVVYGGKPLMLVYLGAPQQPGVATSVLSLAESASLKYLDQLTIRLMAADIDSQPSLWVPHIAGISGLHPVNPRYQTWSWSDRLNEAQGLLPSYTATGARVEAFTVSVATPGTTVTDNDGGWNAPNARLYDRGKTFMQFMKYAKELKPIFLIVSQFNEYAAPDQGNDEDHSSDIEPTRQWGDAKFRTIQKALLSYEVTDGHP
jgi:hypothetical protein